MSTFITFAAAAEAGGHQLPMPAWAFGLVALVVFALLLLLVWMFRHTAQTMIEGGHGPSHTAHGTHGSHATHERPAHEAQTHTSHRTSGPGSPAAEGRHH